MLPDNLKDLYRCDQCNGTGKIFFRLNNKIPFIDCDICGGTGECEVNALWLIQGEKLHDYRIQQEITLREFASIYSIDPSNLSKMERGLIRPEPSLIKMICEK